MPETSLHAPRALLPSGWARDVRVSVSSRGHIAGVDSHAPPRDGDQVLRDQVLLPAPGNLHSHAFQRALAGRTQAASDAGQDSFWSWRRAMYRFVDRLTPDLVEAITAQAQAEMLEAGFAAVAEFHYLHHGVAGAGYDDPAETSCRVMAAALESGIGLTLLPVLYSASGADGRPPTPRQRRFACDVDRFEGLWTRAADALRSGPADWRLGVAAHSLRAVPPGGLAALLEAHRDGPIHLHIAEQIAEVDEVRAALGTTPVAWLLDHHEVDQRWCLVHATHMTDIECDRLAASGAVAGLCPITEADLGDGLFPARRFLAAGGEFGVGSDSNVSISLAGELQLLEYGQRLATRERNVLCQAPRSTARTLFDVACAGGARALGRDSGAIEVGRVADLLTLDASPAGPLALDHLAGDELLDGWVFSTRAGAVSEVWSAGRHLVRGGRHVARDAIAARYRRAVARLVAA